MLYNGVVSINILVTNTGDLFELPRIKFLAVLNQIENSLLQKLSEFIEELLHPSCTFIYFKRKPSKNLFN